MQDRHGLPSRGVYGLVEQTAIVKIFAQTHAHFQVVLNAVGEKVPSAVSVKLAWACQQKANLQGEVK